MVDENINFGLADMDVADDLNVSMDNDTYQDQANPAPPAAGNYSFKAVSLGPKLDRTSKKPVFEGGDNRFPTFTLVTAEIVEGLENPRKVSLFHDIKTKPFARFGTPASGLGDITRAYGTENWAGVRQGLQLLEEAAQTGVFAAQLDWGIYDGEFVTAALEATGLANVDKDSRTDDQKKLLNAIYKAAKVTGMKFFPYNATTGRFSHVFIRESVTFKNPNSGVNVTIDVPHRTIEARPQITRFFPKSDVDGGRVKIGPFNTKPVALKVAA